MFDPLPTVPDSNALELEVLERWRDHATHIAHLARPQTAAVFQKWDGRVEVMLKKYDGVNERGVMD